MPIITEKHAVSWAVFPHNNDRTAWRPFNLPILLVEPDRRDGNGNPIEFSRIQSVRIIIEDVPRKSLVAGHDHVGLLFPDRELYARTLSTRELYERLIDHEAQVFFQPDGTEIDFTEAVRGDFMQYTTTTGVRDTVTFIPSANYYDISDVAIETEELPPDFYFLAYQAEYFIRITSNNEKDQLICIDGSKQATAVYRFKLNHPGQVMEESVRLTPAPYFDEVKKADDSTVAFYRPFTDVLQNIFDEQNLIESLNWVDHVTPEFIPYLAFLLGLDIPFFPKSLDRLRRTMLRNIVRLQQLKGSRRALIDLFELFGVNIFLINLFWSKDGKRLIRPGESLPDGFRDQEIDIESVSQIEPCLAGYKTDGFGQLDIPLLFRPTETKTREGVASVVEAGDVILDAYLIDIGSDTHTELLAIKDAMDANPSGYGESVNGELPSVIGSGLRGYSQIIISGDQGLAVDETLAGIQPPFIKNGVKLRRNQNILNLTFNGAILFDEPNVLEAKRTPGLELFCFATYSRQKFIIPPELEHLQSNRFDLQLVTHEEKQITPDILEFLIDFLFKLKAFHSLLNVIIISQEITETYNVTDFCVGGDFETRFDTDAGKLQVPPAIIPDVPEEGECSIDATSLGYKPEDIALRRSLDLEEEHEAWKNLDSTASDGPDNPDVSRIEQITDSADRTECKFNDRGQDRILVQSKEEGRDIEFHPGPNAAAQSSASDTNLNESPIDNAINGTFMPTGADASTNSDSKKYGSFIREYTLPLDRFCIEDGITDFCYKARVGDELLHQQSIAPGELFRCHPCHLGMGSGMYYLFPSSSTQIRASKPRVYSGSATSSGELGYQRSILKPYLTHPYNKALPRDKNNYHGRLLRAYDTPSPRSLHYTDRPYLDSDMIDQANYLAVLRPELDIELPTLHFPGCRFATMGNLRNDFTHPTWKAKPWDDQYSVPCGPLDQPCADNPSYLNAELIESTNGDLVLSFDDTPFTIIANGLQEDITSMGDHTLGAEVSFDSNNVVHAVYTDQFSGHPAVVLESTEECEETLGGGVIVVSESIFNSAQQCNTDMLDVCDGYPSDFGFKSYTGEDLGREGLYEDFIEQEDIPRLEDPTSVQVLFFLISGIRTTSGYRLDCGCTIVECEGTIGVGSVELPCGTDFFIDSDGDYDWNCDQIRLEHSIKLEEIIGGGSSKLNGIIPSMFELI